jgi:hypothetical protein
MRTTASRTARSPRASIRTQQLDAADPVVLQLLEKLSSLCASHPGQVPARLHLEMPAGYRVVVQSGDEKRVMPSDELIAAIERIKGVTGVVRT